MVRRTEEGTGRRPWGLILAIVVVALAIALYVLWQVKGQRSEVKGSDRPLAAIETSAYL